MERTPKSNPIVASTPSRFDCEDPLLLALGRGDEEISAGRGYDLDQVLDDADRILNADPK